MTQQIGTLVAQVSLAALLINMVVTLGRLFWIIGEEVWNCHGWKLFKHPTLKPGVRVTIKPPSRRSFVRAEGCTGTIQKQVYKTLWSVLIDGEVEPYRYYIEEMEIAACPKAYEELFI